MNAVSRLRARSAHGVSGAIRGGNAYEPHVERQLRAVLRPGMTFVDVGANIGYHTFLAASLVGPTGRVVAFDASSENCRMLLLSRLRNDASHVDIRPVALDRETGVALLGHHIGTNAGLAENDATSIARGDRDVVVARRFDDEVDAPVHVVKVDVEGAELRVLEGATRTLERDRPVVVMEFSCEMVERVSGVDARDALGFLTDRGYRLSVIEKPSGRLVPCASPVTLLEDWGEAGRIEDLLFVPEDA